MESICTLSVLKIREPFDDFSGHTVFSAPSRVGRWNGLGPKLCKRGRDVRSCSGGEIIEGVRRFLDYIVFNNETWHKVNWFVFVALTRLKYKNIKCKIAFKITRAEVQPGIMWLVSICCINENDIQNVNIYHLHNQDNSTIWRDPLSMPCWVGTSPGHVKCLYLLVKL